MKNLIKQVKNFSFQHSLWNKGDQIIVGVSGGPDSVCLLNILVKIAPKYNLKLRIAHVNYGIRKKDADRDERIVKQLAEQYRLKIDILRFKTSHFSTTKNLENKLRDIRYDFFEKLLKEHGFDSIAIAHNQDDQAETVLMRLIRGSGLQGLGAMRAKTNSVIRPLLNTSKKNILNYLKSEKINFGIDITNKDTRFLRNKFRHRLLPYLEKNYNPKIKESLSKTSALIADDYDFILQSAKKSASKIIQENLQENQITIDTQKFLKLHSAIQKHTLRILITDIKKDLKDIENSNIEEILKIIKSTKKKSQILEFKGLKINKKNDRVIMIKM